MNTNSEINEVLESISKLSIDDQSMIAEIIHARVIEEKRKLLANSIRESREEYTAGKASRGTVKNFISEIDSE